MSVFMLLIGAVTMVGIGTLGGNEPFVATGLGLMWIAFSVIVDEL